MRKLALKTVKRVAAARGYEIKVSRKANQDHPKEFGQKIRDLIDYIIEAQLTMTSRNTLFQTARSCIYAEVNNIQGDFVECGVWRGGHAILAHKIFQSYNSDRKVYLFDTFAGMTRPTQDDQKLGAGEFAIHKYNKMQREDYNEWCFASTTEVRANFESVGADWTRVQMVQGDVIESLRRSEVLPNKIAVLRLDTDWYLSTKKELEILYPKLSANGVLIVDDYGSWSGSRKAVDEYFSSQKFKPLIHEYGASVSMIRGE